MKKKVKWPKTNSKPPNEQTKKKLTKTSQQ